uniref:Translation initiation factor 1 n=1 Tax=Monotropa uniflora TaxID=50148 RepID=A0A221SR07_MONUN|nr:translation initiation factor 1 [Monotropa uniflora]ASN78977.1 translation initiation factor 1 [Monotropa uniflora]
MNTVWWLYRRVNFVKRIVHRLTIKRLNKMLKEVLIFIKNIFFYYFCYFLIIVLFLTLDKLNTFFTITLKKKGRVAKRFFWKKLLLRIYLVFILILVLLKLPIFFIK